MSSKSISGDTSPTLPTGAKEALLAGHTVSKGSTSSTAVKVGKVMLGILYTGALLAGAIAGVAHHLDPASSMSGVWVGVAISSVALLGGGGYVLLGRKKEERGEIAPVDIGYAGGRSLSTGAFSVTDMEPSADTQEKTRQEMMRGRRYAVAGMPLFGDVEALAQRLVNKDVRGLSPDASVLFELAAKAGAIKDKIIEARSSVDLLGRVPYVEKIGELNLTEDARGVLYDLITQSDTEACQQQLPENVREIANSHFIERVMEKLQLPEGRIKESFFNFTADGKLELKLIFQEGDNYLPISAVADLTKQGLLNCTAHRGIAYHTVAAAKVALLPEVA